MVLHILDESSHAMVSENYPAGLYLDTLDIINGNDELQKLLADEQVEPTLVRNLMLILRKTFDRSARYYQDDKGVRILRDRFVGKAKTRQDRFSGLLLGMDEAYLSGTDALWKYFNFHYPEGDDPSSYEPPIVSGRALMSMLGCFSCALSDDNPDSARLKMKFPEYFHIPYNGISLDDEIFMASRALLRLDS